MVYGLLNYPHELQITIHQLEQSFSSVNSSSNPLQKTLSESKIEVSLEISTESKVIWTTKPEVWMQYFLSLKLSVHSLMPMSMSFKYRLSPFYLNIQEQKHGSFHFLLLYPTQQEPHPLEIPRSSIENLYSLNCQKFIQSQG